MQASIYPITPFDAKNGTVVHYSWNGVQTEVAITVKDDTGETAYNHSVRTNLKQIAIPGNYLTNGKTYTAYITITDASDRTNDNADVGIPFLCRETPTFEFDWAGTGAEKTGDTYYLNAYAFNFNIKYSQSNGERLTSWQITLYSSDRIQLSTSGIMYNPTYTESGGVVTSNLSYQFSGFGDRGNYYIRADGRTQNGIEVETEYIKLSSNYASKSIFSMLKAENVPEDGRIYIKSDIISAVCKVYHIEEPKDVEVPEAELEERGLLLNGPYINPDSNTVTTGNHALILPDDYYMVIDEGFQLGTFSNTLLFIDPKPNVPLITYRSSSGSNDATLYYRTGKYSLDWQKVGTPTDGSTVIVRYPDTEHGCYHYGWSTYDGGWGDVIVLDYNLETDTWYEGTAEWAVGDPNAWSYQPGSQACFELIVDGPLHDVYVSNAITQVAKGEKVGVVIVRNENGRYDVKAYNGFNLTTPKESYAASTSEDVG